eukprot:5287407-Amphidinium_carterae.1
MTITFDAYHSNHRVQFRGSRAFELRKEWTIISYPECKTLHPPWQLRHLHLDEGEKEAHQSRSNRV